MWFTGFPSGLDAQCSATPASVAATPPCSATPLQRQLDVRHSWQFKGDRCDRAFSTRVARQGVTCTRVQLCLDQREPKGCLNSGNRESARFRNPKLRNPWLRNPWLWNLWLWNLCLGKSPSVAFSLPSESLPSESLFSEFPPSESLLSEFPPSGILVKFRPLRLHPTWGQP